MSEEISEDDILDMMKILSRNKYCNLDKNIQDEIDFMNLINPYIRMTKEEMELSVPNGVYTIGLNGLVAITDKFGLINCILEIQKQTKP